MGLIALIPLLLIFYFMLIRPQQKRMKEHAALIANLEIGDDIMLSAGIYGTVTDIDREVIEVEVADGVVVRASRSAVTEVVEYDTGDDIGADAAGSSDPDSLGDEA